MREILGARLDHLRQGAALLLSKETITGKELQEVVAGSPDGRTTNQAVAS